MPIQAITLENINAALDTYEKSKSWAYTIAEVFCCSKPRFIRALETFKDNINDPTESLPLDTKEACKLAAILADAADDHLSGAAAQAHQTLVDLCEKKQWELLQEFKDYLSDNTLTAIVTNNTHRLNEIRIGIQGARNRAEAQAGRPAAAFAKGAKRLQIESGAGAPLLPNGNNPWE